MHPTILVADDHSMIRKGLKLCLEVNLGLTDIHETASCSGLMMELRERSYSHLILDIILGDGIVLEVLPNIIDRFPDIRIMIFSMQPAEVYAEAFRHFGIEFFLSKSSSETVLLNVLQRFLDNSPPDRPHVNEVFSGNPFARLSVRELEVLHYVLKGKGTKEISDTLNVKMATISTLKFRIFSKIGVENVRQLTDLANLYNVSF